MGRNNLTAYGESRMVNNESSAIPKTAGSDSAGDQSWGITWDYGACHQRSANMAKIQI